MKTLMMSAVLLAGAALPVAATAGQVAIPLQPLTLDEVHGAHAGGTGCAWLTGADGAIRLAMADDHAVVKLDGHVVLLSPATGAKDLFPFTFDGWHGGNITLIVRKTGTATREGTELIGQPATVRLTIGRQRYTLAGSLECGS